MMKSLCLSAFLLEKKVYGNSRNTKKKLFTYILKFTDSARHMSESLSTLVDNLSELNNFKCENQSFDNTKMTYGVINNQDIVRSRCKNCL